MYTATLSKDYSAAKDFYKKRGLGIPEKPFERYVEEFKNNYPYIVIYEDIKMMSRKSADEYNIITINNYNFDIWGNYG